jgi:hypothetical protein
MRKREDKAPPIQSWTVAPPSTAALYVNDLFLVLRQDRFAVNPPDLRLDSSGQGR